MMHSKENDNRSVEQAVVEIIGKCAWEKLQESSKIGIITTMGSFRMFENADLHIDYASSIITTMKALEYELRIRFFERYIEHLTNNYTPESYADCILTGENRGN